MAVLRAAERSRVQIAPVNSSTGNPAEFSATFLPTVVPLLIVTHALVFRPAHATRPAHAI
jgi:hypothetical protein